MGYKALAPTPVLIDYFTTAPFAFPAPTTLASLLFYEHTKHTHAPGPFYLLFPMPKMFFPQILLYGSFRTRLESYLSVRPVPITLVKITYTHSWHSLSSFLTYTLSWSSFYLSYSLLLSRKQASRAQGFLSILFTAIFSEPK